jgi:hypothetical protein
LVKGIERALVWAAVMEEEGQEVLQVRDRSTCAGLAQEAGVDEVEHNSFGGMVVDDEPMLSWSAWIGFQR